MARMERALENLADAAEKLLEAAANARGWEDIAGAREAYDAAMAEATGAQTAYEAKRKELTLPLIRETVERICDESKNGEDFVSLIGKYSVDKSERNTEGKGYPVHPESKGWPAEFTAAAAALEKPGDISEPVMTDLGIHILYYAGDMPAGEHELTGEEQETLNEAAKYWYQTRELEEKCAQWRGEYEIETRPELLGY